MFSPHSNVHSHSEGLHLDRNFAAKQNFLPLTFRAVDDRVVVRFIDVTMAASDTLALVDDHETTPFRANPDIPADTELFSRSLSLTQPHRIIALVSSCRIQVAAVVDRDEDGGRGGEQGLHGGGVGHSERYL